jgi:hypothetical protein
MNLHQGRLANGLVDRDRQTGAITILPPERTFCSQCWRCLVGRAVPAGFGRLRRCVVRGAGRLDVRAGLVRGRPTTSCLPSIWERESTGGDDAGRVGRGRGRPCRGLDAGRVEPDGSAGASAARRVAGDFTGWTWPVSDEAIRIWARRKGVDPEAAVKWSHDPFPTGRGRRSPPGPVYADAEASARGPYVTPRERRFRGADA